MPDTLTRYVEKLTGPYSVEHHQRQVGGGRRLITTTHPALISMLRNASTSTGGAHAGSATPTTRSVVDADAIHLMDRLRESIKFLWWELVPGAVKAGVLAYNRPTEEEALSAWYVTFQAYDHARMLTPKARKIALGECEHWVQTIERKFDPVSTRPLAAPCPGCHERWIVTGEGVLATRVSTLLLTWTGNPDTSSVTCRACDRHWDGRVEMHRLNSAIDRAKPATETAQ